MVKEIITSLILSAVGISAFAQKELNTDSLKQKNLNEVVVLGKFDFSKQQRKVLSSLDNYLESNPNINMLKRGAYAWEPSLNGMSTERSVITIDGMRIFGACTDKMDPITSYVEITNLKKASIHNGQNGIKNGATIAGSIDLERNIGGFSEKGFSGLVFSGIESNNLQKIVGTKFQISNPKFYSDLDFTIRDANNYKAGGGIAIAHSQFSKHNLSFQTGWKITPHQEVSTSLIYDKATNVGYPALPMDVAKAEAVIGSLQFVQHHLSENIHKWDSKIYFNKIAHLMDDSQRPNIPIRMDMPGWSTTIGMYSEIQGEKNIHQWKTNLSAYYNKSLAEMTMFSNQVNQNNMYMLTWPGVGTYNSNLFFEDKIQINENWNSKLAISNSLNYNAIESKFGFESLKIFYPNLNNYKLRWLKNIGLNLNYQSPHWTSTLSVGYGDRAPSVSEAYGFYLFNSMDKYDYIGNPLLKNESSYNFNFVSSYHFGKGIIKSQINYFNIHNFIIGQPQTGLIPMTIGAAGIKKYVQLNQAQLINYGLSFDYNFNSNLFFSSSLIYRYGVANNIKLPQIQPLSYKLKLKHQQNTFNTELELDAATAHRNYSTYFGEQLTNAYQIINLSFSKLLSINKKEVNIKFGVENLFDSNYQTFADWNNIPRMGRNLYLNLIFKF